MPLLEKGWLLQARHEENLNIWIVSVLYSHRPATPSSSTLLPSPGENGKSETHPSAVSLPRASWQVRHSLITAQISSSSHSLYQRGKQEAGCWVVAVSWRGGSVNSETLGGRQHLLLDLTNQPLLHTNTTFPEEYSRRCLRQNIQ